MFPSKEDIIDRVKEQIIRNIAWGEENLKVPLLILHVLYTLSGKVIAKVENDKVVSIVPEDTVQLFDVNVAFIKTMLEVSNDPFNVVLTHHAPSYQSVSPQFIGNSANGAFVSNLEEFILDRPKIKVWAHGHTHSPSDYYIGDCRVVANPLGYRRELYKNECEYKPITIEVLR